MRASEREARAEVKLRAAAVERMGDLEVQVQDREVEEQAAADAAEQVRVGHGLAVRGDLAAVEEDVDAGAAGDVERRRERHAELRGPEQPLVAGERPRRQAAQARAA